MAPRWSVEETQALLEAWAPVHQRRLQAQGDPWVPPQLRSSLSLVDEDWRAIAIAVNNVPRARRARAYQTAERCKTRMKYLRSRYAVEIFEKPSTWELFDVVAPFFAPFKLEPSSAAAAAAVEGDPGSAAAKEEAAQEDGGPAAGAAEHGNDGEAGGSRAAGGTARTSVVTVLLRMTDMCERVMLKWLENDAAEKASRN